MYTRKNLTKIAEKYLGNSIVDWMLPNSLTQLAVRFFIEEEYGDAEDRRLVRRALYNLKVRGDFNFDNLEFDIGDLVRVSNSTSQLYEQIGEVVSVRNKTVGVKLNNLNFKAMAFRVDELEKIDAE